MHWKEWKQCKNTSQDYIKWKQVKGRYSPEGGGKRGLGAQKQKLITTTVSHYIEWRRTFSWWGWGGGGIFREINNVCKWADLRRGWPCKSKGYEKIFWKEQQFGKYFFHPSPGDPYNCRFKVLYFRTFRNHWETSPASRWPLIPLDSRTKFLFLRHWTIYNSMSSTSTRAFDQRDVI